ncbi:hypothetical protein F8S20_26525 [Nostoc sp. BAE]|nr:hypothetical protein [Nostoc commune BAE]
MAYPPPGGDRSTTGQSPISSLNLHCSIALKSVVPIPHSLELFLVPFILEHLEQIVGLNAHSQIPVNA